MNETPIYTHKVIEYTPHGEYRREYLCTSFKQAKSYAFSMDYYEIEEIEQKKRH